MMMMQQHALSTSTAVRVERGSLKRSSPKRPQLATSATTAICNHCDIETEEESKEEIKQSSELNNDVLSELKQWMQRRREMKKFMTSGKKTKNIAHLMYPELAQSCVSDLRFRALFVFDWDDTIFPTNILKRDHVLEADKDELEAMWQELNELVDTVIAIWKAIKIRKGEIKIISSANKSWFRKIFDGDKFEALQPIFQRLEKEIEASDIQIVSARDKDVTEKRNQRRSRSKKSYDGRQAKARCMKVAFADFKRRMEKENAVPVVCSIGDAMEEWNGSHDAFQAVFGRHGQFESVALLQRIKLEKKPESIRYMQEQMEVVQHILKSDTETKYWQYIMDENQVIDYC